MTIEFVYLDVDELLRMGDDQAYLVVPSEPPIGWDNNPKTVILASLTGSGGGVTGGNPPVIDNFNPPIGTDVGAKQEVSFDITDDVALKRGAVFVVQGAQEFVLHDGDNFRGEFQGRREPIASGGRFGFRYFVTRKGEGWTAPPTYRYLVTDNAGQEAT